MAFRIQVRNYRGLRAVDWQPEGVCALVGANGSGKTTLLEVPALLGTALDRGLARALEQHGGIADARNLSAPDDESYGFEVALGDVAWRLAPVLTGAGFRPEERVEVGGHVRLARDAGADEVTYDARVHKVRDTLAFGLVEADEPRAFELGRVLRRYELHASYDLLALRRSGSPDSSELRLDARGTNVFSVLRNWRDRRDDRRRHEFVIEGLREMFPNFFDDLDFEKAAQVVGARLHLASGKSHSANLAPDGWFVGLLHLAAVASTQPGDVIAIDEPENALHPHALKILVERLRAWSSRHQVTVLLATHSPVILNEFDEAPDQLFVMEAARPVQPVALDELKDRDWLAHFAMGELYMREAFGAPDDDGDQDRAGDHG